MKTLKKLTRADALVVTADEIKQNLRFSGCDDDALIRRLIVRATAQVEADSGHVLPLTTFRLRLDSFPCSHGYGVRVPQPITLPGIPLVSVEAVKYRHDDGTAWTTMDAADFVVCDPDKFDGAVLPVCLTWPTAYRRPQAVEILYTAGGSPSELGKQAVTVLAVAMYENPVGESDTKTFATTVTGYDRIINLMRAGGVY